MNKFTAQENAIRRQQARKAALVAAHKAGLTYTMAVGTMFLRVWGKSTMQGIECESCGADCWCMIPRTWEIPSANTNLADRATAILLAAQSRTRRTAKALGLSARIP